MRHIRDSARRHPVVLFYLLAFAVSWSGWVPQALHARGLFPFDHPALSVLGGVGPTVAAVVVTLLSGEKGEVGRLFKPLLSLRAPARWFLFAFGFWSAAGALAVAAAAAVGRSVSLAGRLDWTAVLAAFAAMLLSNVWEEIGWRGFALPRLQTRWSDLRIAVAMGLLWGLWHLPLLANPASPMSRLPWYGEVVFSVSATVLYTWLYRNTAPSLFFVSNFHAMSNTVAFALAEQGAFVSSYPFVVGIVTAAALAVVTAYGPERFGGPSVRAKPRRPGG